MNTSNAFCENVFCFLFFFCSVEFMWSRLKPLTALQPRQRTALSWSRKWILIIAYRRRARFSYLRAEKQFSLRFIFSLFAKISYKWYAIVYGRIDCDLLGVIIAIIWTKTLPVHAKQNYLLDFEPFTFAPDAHTHPHSLHHRNRIELLCEANFVRDTLCCWCANGNASSSSG